MPADYEKQSYWRDRFASETSFEWLVTSAQFMDLLDPHLQHLPRSAKILQVGFGTSDLQNHFRARGFTDVTNIDYEPLAADRGRQLERDAFGDVRMEYAVADATQLRMPHRYDLVVDKSTTDAVSCGGEQAFRRMCSGVNRCLAPGAAWISLSYSASRFDVVGLPFHIEVMDKVLASKFKATDPDVYHWCFLVRSADS